MGYVLSSLREWLGVPQLGPLFWLVHFVYFLLLLVLVGVSVYFMDCKAIEFAPFKKKC